MSQELEDANTARMLKRLKTESKRQKYSKGFDSLMANGQI